MCALRERWLEALLEKSPLRVRDRCVCARMCPMCSLLMTINRVFFPLQPFRSVEHTGCGLKTKEVV